jgi:hypothetical protein
MPMVTRSSLIARMKPDGPMKKPSCSAVTSQSKSWVMVEVREMRGLLCLGHNVRKRLVVGYVATCAP